LNKKKRVGITGGIGAGKTLVCRILNAMGYPVFYSDSESKKILNSDPVVKAAILDLFGAQAYQNNQLNRSFISDQVFTNPERLARLNAIAHPAVRNAFEKWITEQDSPLIFNEAAILFETGIYKNYDVTVVVTAPIELRIRRVIERDNTDEASVRSRIEKQWTDDQKRTLADFEIVNNEDDFLIPQLLELIQKLKE
jgi:dephospho-CoA kinase